ncbi:hypothetical protein [Psychrobacter lutiphocae]|uniref:hypothetical protein n=1 Tax=Psychrobacter lutiphocae TaxID=540500 RepID=UPI00035E29FB|nr:hypothetical protein [Psychrobacter lutiphocae]
MSNKLLLSTLIVSILGISGCNSALMAIDKAKQERTAEREKQPSIDNYIALKQKYQATGTLTAKEHITMARLLRNALRGAYELPEPKADYLKLHTSHIQAAAKLGDNQAARDYNQLLIFTSVKATNPSQVNTDTQVITDISKFKQGLNGLMQDAKAFDPETQSIYQYFDYSIDNARSDVFEYLKNVLQAKDATLYPELVDDMQLLLIFNDYQGSFKTKYTQPDSIYKLISNLKDTQPVALERYYVLAKLTGDQQSASKIKTMLTDSASLSHAESLYQQYIKHFNANH